VAEACVVGLGSSCSAGDTEQAATISAITTTSNSRQGRRRLALIPTIYASSTPVGHSCDGGQSSLIAVNGRLEYRDSRVTVEAFVRLGWFA
jgi:hypothetical protein